MNLANCPSTALATGCVRDLAVGGDRAAAIYAAHELLEESLARLPVVFADTKRYNPNFVDPWLTVSMTLDSLCHHVDVCLQLFRTGVRLERSKGLRSIATLYNSPTPPAERVKSLFGTVCSVFAMEEHEVPIPAFILYKFAETIRAFDAGQASVWLQRGLKTVLLFGTVELPSEAYDTLSYLSVFAAVRHKNAQKSIMAAILTLLIRAQAEAGERSTLIQEKKANISRFLDDSTVDSLLAFELSAEAVMKRKRERIQQIQQRQEICNIAGAVESSGPKVSEANAQPGSAPGAHEPPVAGLLGRASRFLQIREWSQQPSRLIMILVHILLLCILLRRAVSVSRFVCGLVRGTSYGARKSLVL
ncbi:hypothetical protein TRVL_03043 [Trypanosoma vivax]|nr:hypothetical protein TRVL_03043 [Trypanosoma vivax]